MNRIELAWLIYEIVPDAATGGEGPVRAAAAVLDCLERCPGTAVGLHLTGGALEIAASIPELAVRMRQAAVKGQLELIGGTMHAALLPSIPHADALAQMAFTAERIEELTGQSPEGVWIPGQVWEPALPMLLATSGASYAALDESLLSCGVMDDTGPGVRVVEKLGYRLNLLGIDEDLSNLVGGLEPDAFVAELERRATAEGALVVVAEPLERYLTAGAASWLSGLFGRLAEEAHWISMHRPGTVAAQRRSAGAVHLPALMPEEMALRSVSPEQRRVYSRQRDAAVEANGVPMPAGPQLLPWDRFLGRYPEANRLHKKMLWVSSRVHRMARLVHERRVAGEDVSVLAPALERARRALYAGQTHAPLWPGPSGGLYRSEVRGAVWKRLLEAQRITDAVFYPEPRWVSHEEVDLDRDGRMDYLVGTPRIEAGFSARGGAVFELSYKPAGLTLMDVAGRRPEWVHGLLTRGGVARRSRRKERGREATPLAAVDAKLEPRLRYDRYRRLGFLDHFLGTGATPENFYQGRYPEAGDFLDGDYELCRLEYDRRTSLGVLHLSRNGFVGEPGTGQRHAVRVEKAFHFDDSGARVGIRYAIRNRSHEPVSLRFGPELVFGTPLEPVIDGQTARDAYGALPVGSAAGLEGIELVDASSRVRVRVCWEKAADCWWHPIETLYEQEGAVVLQRQGCAFLPWWTVALWGEETRLIDLSIEVLEPIEPPETIIEDADSG